jgi:NitT/TauT family transport system ATP-binding protein
MVDLWPKEDHRSHHYMEDATDTAAPLEIECSDLEVRFSGHSPVLDRLNCNFPAGQIVVLLGRSGCGKSTLLRCVAGLQKPTSGRVRLSAAGDRREARPRMSFVFQEATLLPWRSAIENVLLPTELDQGLSGVGRHEARRLAVERLEEVGLEAKEQQKLPRQLSGGMKMRVALARALMNDPDVLLLDEPFAALDDILRIRLNELLLQLWSHRPRTILFVTHNISEAIFLSHQIAIMHQGRIGQQWMNPLPFPREHRLRATPEFSHCYGVVSSALESLS